MQLCGLRHILHQALRPYRHVTQLLPEVCTVVIFPTVSFSCPFTVSSIFWDAPTTCPPRTPPMSSLAVTVTSRTPSVLILPMVRVSIPAPFRSPSAYTNPQYSSHLVATRLAPRHLHSPLDSPYPRVVQLRDLLLCSALRRLRHRQSFPGLLFSSHDANYTPYIYRLRPVCPPRLAQAQAAPRAVLRHPRIPVRLPPVPQAPRPPTARVASSPPLRSSRSSALLSFCCKVTDEKTVSDL